MTRPKATINNLMNTIAQIARTKLPANPWALVSVYRHQVYAHYSHKEHWERAIPKVGVATIMPSERCGQGVGYVFVTVTKYNAPSYKHKRERFASYAEAKAWADGILNDWQQAGKI